MLDKHNFWLLPRP